MILDESEYHKKMHDLLKNEDTYQEKPNGFAKKMRASFNKNARRIPIEEIRKREDHVASARRGTNSTENAGRPQNPQGR